MAAPLPVILSLDDVRAVLVGTASWRTRGEAANELPRIEVDCNSLVTRVALTQAACFAQKAGADVTAANIVAILSALVPSSECPADIPDVGDAGLVEAISATFPDVPFPRSLLAASQLLAVAAVAERLADLALIIFTIAAEVAGAVPLAAGPYSRENAPLHLSLAAQRVTEIVRESRRLKKDGADLLHPLVVAVAPIGAAVAQVKSLIAKAVHFYDPGIVRQLQGELLLAVNGLLEFAGAPAGATALAALRAVYAFLGTKFEESRAAIGEAKRGPPLGMVSRALLEAGFAAVGQLRYFKGVEAQLEVRQPNGTRDIHPAQMVVRELVISTISGVFRKHGGVAIDTPVFELREVLTEKYGEDSKLIYNLEDQGGELLSLRYDLTVPFARYVATHNIAQIKRYAIGRVYRRDKAQVEKGRYREFFQCDFDIAGPSGPMIADAEIFVVFCEVFEGIRKLAPVFDFQIKMSDRRLLQKITEVCGVPPERFRTVCTSIDKLDKEPWADIRDEIIKKGLSVACADGLGEFVKLKGKPQEVLPLVAAKLEGSGSESILQELDTLFKYLDGAGVIGKISFDVSLARGLDYYTGVILEAVSVGDGVDVGSIAGGGRYDDLIGMFCPTRKVPAVGASVGIERLFTLIEGQLAEQCRAADTQVYVASIGQNFTTERLTIAGQLWAAGISTEFSYKEKPPLPAQLSAADALKASLVVIIAPKEWEEGTVKIKRLASKEEETVPRGEIVQRVKELLG